MSAGEKYFESGKTVRVLLDIPTSLLTLPRPRAVPFALDASAGPLIGRVQLLSKPRVVVDVCEVDGDDRFSSETTRARENPHTQPDAVAVGAHRCASAHCSGCVDVPRWVEACC